MASKKETEVSEAREQAGRQRICRPEQEYVWHQRVGTTKYRERQRAYSLETPHTNSEGD